MYLKVNISSYNLVHSAENVRCNCQAFNEFTGLLCTARTKVTRTAKQINWKYSYTSEQTDCMERNVLLTNGSPLLDEGDNRTCSTTDKQ